jgi:hypothetical protein
MGTPESGLGHLDCTLDSWEEVVVTMGTTSRGYRLDLYDHNSFPIAHPLKCCFTVSHNFQGSLGTISL